MGTLYVLSTPIGNLEDLTFRGARILGEVDQVLAEDTRRASILLRHLELRVPVRSLHAHNEEERTGEALARLGRGECLALISDAGTPLVSDPGARLVRRAADEGHRVVPVPGPSAVLAALVASGLDAGRFSFLGFPPRKGRDRGALLERAASAEETTVWFESPERLADLLDDLSEACGSDRRAAVGRELTKLHEEVRRGTLGELSRYYRENPPRGEITVVLAARPAGEGDEEPGRIDRAAVEALAGALLDEGRSPSRAAREVARRLGVPRNRVYELVQELSRARGEDSSP
jgi:16S rRNA (cytidine1402-2'-O)-methyltransferase